MMKSPLIFLLAAFFVAPAGCSHPADKAPDYHALLGKNNVANMIMAVAKCNESATAAERATNPWCGVVQKANRCMDPSYFGETPATACPAR